MPISEERFNRAAEVIEAGATAAAACGAALWGWETTFDKLTGDLRDEDLSQDALLDLLTVALMKLAVERRDHDAREAILRG